MSYNSKLILGVVENFIFKARQGGCFPDIFPNPLNLWLYKF